MNMNILGKEIKHLFVDNTPLILTSIAVGGVVTTSAMAVKATPQAVIDIQNAESEQTAPLTFQEKALLTWKHYIPSVAVGAVTIAAIIGSHSISTRRNAALISVYSITETAFKEYQAKVKEQIGNSKERKVREEVAKDYIMSAPMINSEVLITGLGEQLCFDTYTGRYFKSDIETIRKAQNDINAHLISDTYCSQNDFYRLINLPPTSYGEEIGWTVDNMMDLEYSSHLADDGRPCLAIEYHTPPVRDYYKLQK